MATEGHICYISVGLGDTPKTPAGGYSCTFCVGWVASHLDRGAEGPTPGPSRTREGRKREEGKLGDTPKPPDRGTPLSTPFVAGRLGETAPAPPKKGGEALK